MPHRRLRRPWGATAAVLLAALPLGSATADEGWRRTRPQGSFLSVLMPPVVTDRSGVRDTVVGEIRHRTISAEVGDVKLSLTVTKLPRAVTLLTTRGLLFRKARGELVGNFGGQATDWRTCERHGIECRALRYDLGDGDRRKGRAQLFLRDGVLVVLNVVHPDSSDGLATAQAFLGSSQP